MLVKQRLEGISSDSFALSGVVAMAAATHLSVATVCFFGFGPAPNILKSFMPFSRFILQKQTSQIHRSSLANISKG
jgi:hypothetical protein